MTSINEAMNIAAETNYTNREYSYLKNVSITEWDISSAGLSVLKFRKLLPEEELDKLSKMEKHTRTVYEGNLQKENPALAEAIVNTLSKVRQAFVVANNIPPEKILSIKKDAIFLINFTPEVTTIKDYFVFRKKGTYTSFIQIEKKEFYYNSGTDVLDVKGISKEGVIAQREYLLKDIAKILKSSEKVDMTSLYSLLKSYRRNYLTKELPVEYYRELDSGLYRMGRYTIQNISEAEKEHLDITQNYMSYILPMIQTLL